MAVVIGINCGFVTSSPTADPEGSDIIIDTFSRAQKHVAPAGAIKITEVGWYCGRATEAANFEVGLYSHDAINDDPDQRLYVDNTNAKGTDIGWKKVVVDWTITAGITYWLAVQLDNTVTLSTMDYKLAGATRSSEISTSSLLPVDWGDRTETVKDWAIYALYETAGVEYIDIAGVIAGTSDLSGTLSYLTQVDLVGVIAGVSSLSGTVELLSIVDISGTVADTSILTGVIILSSNWQIDNFCTIKRLVAIGNDSLYYEDI